MAQRQFVDRFVPPPQRRLGSMAVETAPYGTERGWNALRQATNLVI